MDQYVCVRLIQANAMDLAQFQFDYDLTFAVFMMNADGTVYGRFGSRSDHNDATRDISMLGLRKALETGLELHKTYPEIKATLASKRGEPPQFKTPEDFPLWREKKGKQYKATLDYEGKVMESCMHCHQVRDAQLRFYRDDHKSIPDSVLYAWPMPDVIGLALDPDEKAKVKNVGRGSAAEKAGFERGDEILTLAGQPLISIADVQWVLHNAGEPATLKAEVLRGKRKIDLKLDLGTGWRRSSDLAWRTTTWDLRRMATGGLVLKELTPTQRREAKLDARALALQVEYVGQFGDHAVGKNAGFKKSDVIVTVDGRSEKMTESQLLAYLVQNKMRGDHVAVSVLREGARLNFELPMQ